MASRWVRGPEKAFNDEQMLELATFFNHSNCEEVNRGSRFRKVALRLQNLFDGGLEIGERMDDHGRRGSRDSRNSRAV